MSELKIKEKRVIDLSKKCPEFRKFAEKLWPELFETKWENISHEIRVVTTHHMSTIGIEIYHSAEKIGFIDPNGGMKIVSIGYMADWVTPNRWEVYKKI